MSMASTTFPCPCCGYLVFDEPPGSYSICPICYWEDDLSQLRFVDTGGANIPLIEAQKNFKNFGAIESRFAKNVRAPLPSDKKEPNWRPIDLSKDLEKRVPGKDYGSTYPKDLTELYYWRK